jgi:hypothetical protein
MLKSLLLAVVTVIVIFGAAYALRTRLFPGSGQPAQLVAAPEPVPVTVSARVTDVRGVVERRSSNRPDWYPLATGDALNPTDALRTHEGASAELAIGGRASVGVAERSEFRVGDLSEGLSQVKLEGGRIHARVRSGGDAMLRVEVKDNAAVIEARDSDFAMLRGEDAQVTVAANAGSLDVIAQQQRVHVAQGEQSIVIPEQPPTPPSRIPPSLFLKISRSIPRRVSKPDGSISGETSPGAVVRVNGGAARVGTDGSFTAAVPLVEGKNNLVVTVEDALGRKQVQELAPVTLDTKAPSVKGRVVW